MASKTNTTRAERLRLASQERREQAKQELHQTILDAAGELFLEHGYEDFSLRQVAEQIGYSPGTIYLYFNDKDDLLFSLADEGFAEFGRRLGAAANSSTDPQERLVRMGRAYVEFGLQNPRHYRLMFMQRTDFLMERPEADYEPRISTFHILQDAVEEAMAAGVVRQADPVAVSDSIWAQFHGLVALAIGMPNMMTAERTAQALEQIITTMVNGLKPA